MASNTTSRNGFQDVKSMLHFVDNAALPEGNKIAKVESLGDDPNAMFVWFGMSHLLLSIGESVEPSYSHHSAEMFIRGEPIRLGFKVWPLCDGYPYHLHLYKGKVTTQQPLPLGACVVNTMRDENESRSHVSKQELF